MVSSFLPEKSSIPAGKVNGREAADSALLTARADHQRSSWVVNNGDYCCQLSDGGWKVIV
jgi:hypothetical protein